KKDEEESKNQNIEQHEPADVVNSESRKVNMSTMVGHDEGGMRTIVFD
ncbi:18303_t:CDS:1, partial [Gigaspora rosea]